MAEEEKNKKTGDPSLYEPDTAPDASEFEETILRAEADISGQANAGDVPYLIIVQGPHQGLKFHLKTGDNVIGRVMGSEIILEDQSVSRKHALVSQSREGWSVEDMDSKNGTFVNGQKIDQKVVVGHGDVVQVGIYSLRLITRAASKEEVVKPLPPDWEGRTVLAGSNPDEETATVAEEVADKIDEEADREGTDSGASDGTREIMIPEELSVEKKKVPWWLLLIIVLGAVAVLAGSGTLVYFKFFHKSQGPVSEDVQKPAADSSENEMGTGEEIKGVPAKPEIKEPVLPPEIPMFLDFAASPFSAKIYFQGAEVGETPVKIQEKLKVDGEYVAKAVFNMSEIGEKYEEETSFKVNRDEPLIPIFFKGPIGVLKVMELPRDVELYLEGYFVYDPFNPRTAKLNDIVFGKPIYVPFGKYIVELRQDRELVGTSEFIKDIRYRREVLVTEDNPVFILKITESDLNEFPVEIQSVPTNADVFIDAKKVGVTPYKGIFPLGEHQLGLRKEGYFEHQQEFNMDKNVQVKMEIVMKTTEAGELVNAGKHLMQNGRYKEAIDKLTEIFKLTPTEGEAAQAKYLIGSCFIHLGDLSTAENYFLQVVGDERMKYPAMLGLVSVYYGLGRKNDSIPHLVEVFLNSKDDIVLKEAHTLFQQISPLKSIMYVYTTPGEARVYVNNKLIEQPTPLILPDLSLGNYKIRIEKDGYIPQDLSINVSVAEFNPVIVELKPIPQ